MLSSIGATNRRELRRLCIKLTYDIIDDHFTF